jgi:Putative auto-transporter adhesin, head GIN domain
MKTSNKILWIAIGGLFACVVVFLLFIRVSTSPMMERVEPMKGATGSKEMVSRSYPLKYFTGIRASGKWGLKLTSGETYSVEIEAPEYLLPGLIVEKEGDVLTLGLEQGWRLKGGELKALVTLPNLASIKASGSVTIDMNGFDSERLKIKASGATELGGKANKIYYLTLKGSGSTRFDLMDNPVTFLEIDLSGSSTIAVTMAGGDLKGNISGSGTVVYDGDIRDQEVSISGSGSVKRRKSTG